MDRKFVISVAKMTFLGHQPFEIGSGPYAMAPWTGYASVTGPQSCPQVVHRLYARQFKRLYNKLRFRILFRKYYFRALDSN